MKPTNSPTPGQPNQRKNRLKVEFWGPQQILFRGLGLILYRKDYKKPNPTKVSANTVVLGCFAIYQIVLGWKTYEY